MKTVVFLWPCWADAEKTRTCHSDDSLRIFQKTLRASGLKQHIVKHRTLYDGTVPRGKKPSLKSCRLAWDQLKSTLKADVLVPVGSLSFQIVAGNSRRISSWGGRVLNDTTVSYPVFGLMHPDQVSYAPASHRELLTQVQTLDRFVNDKQQTEKTDYVLVSTTKEAAKRLEACGPVVGFDYETTGLDPLAPSFRVRTIAFSDKHGSAFVIDVQACGESLNPHIIRWLTSPRLKVAHNAKFEHKVSFAVYGVAPRNLHCTMLMHHVLDEEASHGLEVLAFSYTSKGGYDTALLQEFEKGFDWVTVPMETLWPYNATDADVTLRSYYAIKEQLRKDRHFEGMWSFYSRFARPMMSLLAKVEHHGMHVSDAAVEEVESKLRSAIENAKKKMVKDRRVQDALRVLGLKSIDDLNLKSPVQTAKLLFDVCGFEPHATTETGTPSTSDLELIKNKDELVDMVIEVRSCLHDLSVLDELKVCRRVDSCVSSNFYQPGTVTWRLASKQPPLQNLPRNGRVKSVFTSRFAHGHIVQADFSQLEVRILGCLTKEPGFAHAFNTGYDFHTYTASLIFKTPMDSVTKDQRNSAKRVNFGVIFGIGPNKLASQIGSTFIVAKKLLDDFYLTYPKVAQWVEDNRKLSTRQLRVVSLVGQVRRLKDARHEDQFTRWRAQRQGVNFLIAALGSAMTQFAMLRVDRTFQQEKMEALVVGQVHDSIIIDCPPEETSRVGVILHDVMTRQTAQAYEQLTIPLVADVSFGLSYGDQERSIDKHGETT